MFRNPRENAYRSPTEKITPSVGRPPSPPTRHAFTKNHNPVPTTPLTSTNTSLASASIFTFKEPAIPSKQSKMPAKTVTRMTSTMTQQPRLSRTTSSNTTTSTIVSAFANSKSPKSAAATATPPNKKRDGNIMSFFKKGEALQGQANELFFSEPLHSTATARSDEWTEESVAVSEESDNKRRFNEQAGPVKKMCIEEHRDDFVSDAALSRNSHVAIKEDALYGDAEGDKEKNGLQGATVTEDCKLARQRGPFVDEPDSEAEDATLRRIKEESPTVATIDAPPLQPIKPEDISSFQELHNIIPLPNLERSNTENIEPGDFEGFGDNDDSDLDDNDGEEYQERRWMEEQSLLEMEAEQAESGHTTRAIVKDEFTNANDNVQSVTSIACPLCSTDLKGFSDQEASVHVNKCLDGNVSSPPEVKIEKVEYSEVNTAILAKRFSHVLRDPKPGQANPFTVGSTTAAPKSAFSKMMSGHAEDAAWADAAAAETAARGKPAYQRTCPFYKIIPGFSICVDAFRYGAVAGCEAYFLSHFHSDHYVGLTSTWCHGPIYCSRVTGNLVKQQLRVDPKYVIALEFEEEAEIPRTGGAKVTMVPANHCPGSSLYLFEKKFGAGANSRNQRILHCGDFRACRAHIEHPLLRPDSVDDVLKKSKQQKIDVCYLDTTYLNPKYAFPCQEEVIQACADMCVSLSKDLIDKSDNWETVKREREGSVMTKFIQTDSDIIKQEMTDYDNSPPMGRGRLLVIVGTYSIGKERICMGIAKALNSKIYAPPGKQRICNCLEDPELSARLTSDPREAQVHMTPLFEIRAETLEDYLKDYRKFFSRAVGFRPSGWNYRPPNTRFLESPSVQTVLYSQSWKSTFSMRELVPQRGSTSRAACFGVPYSEHSSFRELTMFCCALRIEKVIPTVNVGSAKSRERMKAWTERWALDRKKNGLFKLDKDGKSFW